MTSIDSTDNNLPKTRNILEKILKNTVEGIIIIGDDTGIEYVNNQTCEILGMTRDEILGQSFLRFIHPESSHFIEKQNASRLDGEMIPSTYESKILRGNDEYRDIQFRTTVLTNGENKIKILAQLLDVTHERSLQSSLSEFMMKYSTLVKTMNDGLGVIDDTGVLIHANPALCKMLGYTEKELVGKTTVDIMHGFSLDAVFDMIKERIAGKSSRYETQLIHRSGRLIPTMVSASPLLSEDGEYRGSFAIFTDITRQKMAEKDLQTARDRSLLYLDLMRHNLRNHLQEVQVAAELLQYIVDDSSTREPIEHILHAVSKSSRIISETETIETLTELPFSEKLLDMVLKETVMAAIALLDDVEFRLSIQVSEAKVRVDEYLELLLSDLLTNAYEHNPRDDKQVWISLAEEESAYELVVSDNGPGMLDSFKNGLFDARQRSGDLRLQLAQYIIEKYGGALEVLDRVQGHPNQGSKIKVIFPKLI